MKMYRSLISVLSFFVPALIFAQKTYTLEVGQFEKIKVNSNINVVYKNIPDSTGFARYSAPEGMDDLFILSTKGNGTLKIQLAQTQWDNPDFPTVYVYSDFLSSVESSSDRQVYIESLAPCAALSINQIGNGTIIVDNVKCNNLSASITTGNGTINISGRCVNASFRMLGAGLISADRLAADNVKCSIMGTGSIGCWPIDNLQVKGLGTTKIYYKGKPNIKKSGGGKLFELPAEGLSDSQKTGTSVSSFNQPEQE